ncbi:hypothetical protein ACPX19_00980 [Winogradskyella sp. HB-48]|uniref:hypothetical protein n=1 Tax=Winogradskyella sp. HB-48 TaxID=3416808 RepID=UPI003CF9589B
MNSKFYITIFFIILGCYTSFSQIKVLDSISQSPVSYATISFGNGQGIFADDDGMFFFTKKLYPDVDSLHVSAIGFKNLNIATENLPNQLLLQPQTDALDEVILSTNLNRKFKEETLKPYLDDDYYNCWLPTIESEIAVFFERTSDQDQKLTSVTFPIALESKDWNKRKRANSDKKEFSTLFKVQFYTNDNAKPGKALTYETIVFRATEKNGDAYELNVEDYDIYIPKNGFFVSLQVMGYTDKNGKLLPNKKYKEIKTKDGIVKIPTNFRPLLPFTNMVEGKNTYIKRIFINGNNWVKFDKGNGFKSSLLDKNLYNYGIGITYKTFKDE